LEHIPHNVLKQGLTGGGARQVDHLMAVTERCAELVSGDDHAEGFFAVAVDDAREPAFEAKAVVAALAGEVAFFNLESIGHGT
jgi:hypothetical protein